MQFDIQRSNSMMAVNDIDVVANDDIMQFSNVF